MTLQPFAVAPVMGQLAATPAAGVALVNGTPTILSWTAPNDGQQHRVMVVSGLHVTSLETGGAVTLTFTLPDGGVTSLTFYGGGAAAGISSANPIIVPVKAGTAVTIAQGSALTGGAALLFAEIWGS